MPSIVGAGILIFLETIALYGTPALIAIPAGLNLATTQIVSFFEYPLRVEQAAAFSMPILALTASDAVSDRIAGLDRGADDCLAKLFHPQELLARARALIRRGLKTPDPVLRAGTLSFDRSTRTVELNRSVIALRRRELAVLETLMGRAGRIVTRECLTSEVFSFADAVAPNAIDVYVGRLRRKLTPDGPVIRTVRGQGYLLEAG